MPDEFEQYLMSFQPREPEPLPRVPRQLAWRRRWWIPAVVAASVAMALLFRPVEKPAPQPFTVATASALLASETQWNQVLDTSAFPQRKPVGSSMIEFLSQEKLSK